MARFACVGGAFGRARWHRNRSCGSHEAYLLGPSLSGVLTRMERDSLIERHRCPQDARRSCGARHRRLGLDKVQALSQTIEAHYAWMEQQLGKAQT